MMMEPETLKEEYEDAPLDKIIQERDRIIQQIRKYEGKDTRRGIY